jgi:hypothetical protein
MNRVAHTRSVQHRVTPYVAGDSRDPRQRALTVVSLLCFALPSLVVLAVVSSAASGMPTATLLPGAAPWPVLRATLPALVFAGGIGAGLLAIGRSPVRNHRAIVVVVLNGIALVLAGLIVAGPALAAGMGR